MSLQERKYQIRRLQFLNVIIVFLIILAIYLSVSFIYIYYVYNHIILKVMENWFMEWWKLVILISLSMAISLYGVL